MHFNTYRNKGDPRIHNKPMIFVREGAKQLESLESKLDSKIALGLFDK